MSVVESFFGTLKCETIYLQKVKSLADLIRTIDEYIYWYNQERIKLTLGGYSPIQYRLMNQQMINNYKEHKVQENGINSSRLNHLLVYFYPLENSIF
jgi:hypothetical protein